MDEERRIVGVANHVDIFVAQFTHDTVYTRTLDTHTGAYRIDTVVVALHGNLGTLSRDTGYGADIDQAVVYFGNLKLEKTDEEQVVGAADCNLGIVVLVVYIRYHGADSLALTEEVAGNRFAFG